MAYRDSVREMAGGSVLDFPSEIAKRRLTLVEHRKSNGVAYTPPVLSSYLAEKVVSLALQDVKDRGLNFANWVANLRILDPACGNGELLISAWQALTSALASECRSSAVDSHAVFCGIDIDRDAIAKASASLGRLKARSHRLLVRNALTSAPGDSVPQTWRKLSRQFRAPTGFDIVIANPPWGADVSGYRTDLDRTFFTLMRGQFDSSDLFVELSLSLVKPNGFLALILPDSLFSHERMRLRRLLTDNTQLNLVARLGERFFDGINRACAVVICQKVNPNFERPVQCFRLTPVLRKEVLCGRRTLRDAEQEIAHWTPQFRFGGNAHCSFDIDTTDREQDTIAKFRNLPRRLGDYLWSSRGIELSKTGKVTHCRSCRQWMPRPLKARSNCKHCGAEIACSSAKNRSIVFDAFKRGRIPILAGESVSRYSIRLRRWVDPTLRGLNYKERSLYKGPKLLVRKTGVGISASIDYSDAFTTQVVYIFGAKQLSGVTPLEVFLAILSSRAMYYFISKQHGEVEWRSHPYLTQGQILQIPLPDLTKLTAPQRVAVAAIARLLRHYLPKGSDIPWNVDARLEFFVATLLGLSRSDYEVIYRTLDANQGLLPVRALRRVTIDHVFAA